MRNNRKKHFFRIEAKKISLPLRLISLRSENDGAPYSQLIGVQIRWALVVDVLLRLSLNYGKINGAAKQRKYMNNKIIKLIDISIMPEISPVFKKI
jgi:hypothetical protein